MAYSFPIRRNLGAHSRRSSITVSGTGNFEQLMMQRAANFIRNLLCQGSISGRREWCQARDLQLSPKPLRDRAGKKANFRTFVQSERI
jgi:hypothetical protein